MARPTTPAIQEYIASARTNAARNGRIYLILTKPGESAHPYPCESGFLSKSDEGSTVVAVVTPSEGRKAAG